jgi:hypothetical protein
MPLFEAKPEGLCPAFARSFCEAKTPMPKIGREADFWQAMGIPNHDTHPTPIPVPGDIPEVDVQTPLPRVLRFRFRRVGMKRWGKLADVHGMELVWLIADTPPAKVAELVHSAFATRSPLELTFKESERGKRVYFAVRWETGTVKKGKFSAIYSAIIP